MSILKNEPCLILSMCGLGSGLIISGVGAFLWVLQPIIRPYLLHEGLVGNIMGTGILTFESSLLLFLQQ